MKDKFNFNFDENNVPVGVGDRYYSQDMVRDNRYLQNLAVKAVASICQKEAGILKGLSLSQSSATILSLTGGVGYCHFSVTVPDDTKEWSVPPQTTEEDILVLVDAEAQAIQLTEEMLDGETRYIKIRYKEEGVKSRVRQNLGGTYTYVVADSYQITIDKVAPTNYDVFLGTFSGDGSSLVLKSQTTEINKIAQEYYPELSYQKPRWLRFDFTDSNHQSIKILAKTRLRIGNSLVEFTEDKSYNLNSYSLEAGKDYYVFLDEFKNMTISLDKTENNNKLIGQFHTLCADVGDNVTGIVSTELTTTGSDILIKSYDSQDTDFISFYTKPIKSITTGTYYNIATVDHMLSGFKAGDILPESIWCLSFHPDCPNWDGMIYDRDTNIACDIYLQSGKGGSTKSVYGAVHTVSRQEQNHQQDMRAVGKKLLTDEQFTSCALGSNEKTNIIGGSDKTTVGGHSDTAGRRMISFIGVEEMCGYLWQWLDEISPSGGSGWGSADGQSSFGQSYGIPYVLIAGGTWDYGASCGSRCRGASDGRSFVYATVGGRGSSRIIRGQ